MLIFVGSFLYLRATDKILRVKNYFIIIITGHSVGVWRCAAASAAEGSVVAPSCGGGRAAMAVWL